MENTDYTRISRGTRGIFESIERNANRVSAKCLIILASVCSVLVGLTLLVDQSEYMTEVTIAVLLIDLICFLAGFYCLKVKKESRYRKYMLFAVWFVSLCLATTSVDSSVILLYSIPVVLAILYNSVVLTIFVSIVNVIFAFFPFLINTYRGTFPLDYVVLYPGTTVTVTDMSLDGTIGALADSIDRSETIMNMLTYGFLATALFLLLISGIAVVVTAINRKNIVTQYNKARSRMEEDK